MTKQAHPANPNNINMVGEGAVFEGTLRTKSDVRVSGRIIGTLSVGERAIVAQEGAVEGELVARNADIAGSVQGELHVHERLVLRSTARVEGNVRTGRLVVEEGAVFNGECRMGQHVEEPRAVPEAAGDVAPRVPERPGEPRTAVSEGSDRPRSRAI